MPLSNVRNYERSSGGGTPLVGDAVLFVLFYTYSSGGGVGPTFNGSAGFVGSSSFPDGGVDFYWGIVGSGDMGSPPLGEVPVVSDLNWYVSDGLAGSAYAHMYSIYTNGSELGVVGPGSGGARSSNPNTPTECLPKILHLWANSASFGDVEGVDENGNPILHTITPTEHWDASSVPRVDSSLYIATGHQYDRTPGHLPGTTLPWWEVTNNWPTGSVAPGLMSASILIYSPGPTDHVGTSTPPSCPVKADFGSHTLNGGTDPDGDPQVYTATVSGSGEPTNIVVELGIEGDHRGAPEEDQGLDIIVLPPEYNHLVSSSDWENYGVYLLLSEVFDDGLGWDSTHSAFFGDSYADEFSSDVPSIGPYAGNWKPSFRAFGSLYVPTIAGEWAIRVQYWGITGKTVTITGLKLYLCAGDQRIVMIV